MNFNTATVMGRLAADPVFTKGEKADGSDSRCWARIAVNRPVKGGPADFIPICAWGRRAEVLAEHGKKGKVVLVHGTLRTNNKQRPDGSYDNYTEVSVAQIVLGPDAKQKGVPVAATAPQPATATPAAPALDPAAAMALMQQLQAIQALQASQAQAAAPVASADPFGASA